MSRDEKDDDDEEDLQDDNDATLEQDPESFPDGPKTIIVGQWSFIQEIDAALKIACENDTIFCHQGQYDEEVKLCKPRIELTGPADLSAHILKGITSTATFSSISNLHISGGASVKCGNLSITSCNIHDAQHGIQIFQTANPRIQKCIIHSVEKCHISIYPGGNGIIEGCELIGDGRRGTVGLYIDDADKTLFRSNKIHGLMTGVYIIHGCKGVQLYGNEIFDVTGHAVYVDQQSKPMLKGNCIKDAAHYGLLVANGSGGSFTGNVFYSSVRIHRSCAPSFVENIVVAPGEIVNDDSLYALRGITVKKPEDVAKAKKTKDSRLR